MGMMKMLKLSSFIITDSGGFCREAFFSKKPALVIMQHPFWPEIIETGAGIRTLPLREEIVSNFEKLGKTPVNFETGIFGNGGAARIMAGILDNEWKRTS
jgi:UDP-N-acetylglucosamine 2-epimerase